MKKQFSYSELALWKRDKDEYVKRYVLNVEPEPSRDMILGKLIHEAIEDPAFPLVERMREQKFRTKEILNARKLVSKAKLLPEKEVGVVAMLGNTDLISVFDGLDRQKRELIDYKTTPSNDFWMQQRVDYHLQFSFYALVWWLNYHKFFTKIYLQRFNTATGAAKLFETARGPRDIAYVRGEIVKAVGEIKREGWWNRRLSRAERQNQKLL